MVTQSPIYLGEVGAAATVKLAINQRTLTAGLGDADYSAVYATINPAVEE